VSVQRVRISTVVSLVVEWLKTTPACTSQAAAVLAEAELPKWLDERLLEHGHDARPSEPDATPPEGMKWCPTCGSAILKNPSENGA